MRGRPALSCLVTAVTGRRPERVKVLTAIARVLATPSGDLPRVALLPDVAKEDALRAEERVAAPEDTLSGARWLAS